jgi:hypothetical protein
LPTAISTTGSPITTSACTQPGPGCSCFNGAVSGSDCPRDGSGYSYQETLSGNVRSFTVSGCPNHAQVDYTPNKAVKGTFQMNVPRYPMLAGSTVATRTSLVSTGGGLVCMIVFMRLYSLEA